MTSSVRKKVTYENCCFDAPCTMILSHRETPENKRAKIRGFYTTIHGFLLSKFSKKTVSQ